jgi:1-deoxy-D-xylulose-5-phosphate synthase
MQSVARRAAELLRSEGWDVALINPRFFKPLDAGTHEFFGRTADVVATLEDHVLMGGYGSAVLELYSDRGITTPVVRLGWPDQFIEHASTVEHLRQKYGLTPERLVEQIRAAYECARGGELESDSAPTILPGALRASWQSGGSIG